LFGGESFNMNLFCERLFARVVRNVELLNRGLLDGRFLGERLFDRVLLDINLLNMRLFSESFFGNGLFDRNLLDRMTLDMELLGVRLFRRLLNGILIEVELLNG
jgi:hypothetical protein